MTSDIFPARVVQILDDGRIAINRGIEHGIYKGQTFLVYELGEEIFDPETKESLGILEITKGKGEVDHVQEKMATIISKDFEIEEEEFEPMRGSIAAFMGGQRKRKIKSRLPFNNAEVGDRAKPI